MAELAQLKKNALNWLSRRDYSEAQLSQKLRQKGALPEQLSAVIEWCKAQQYLDESRFLSMLVRNRARQGYGYNYLLQECRAQKISVEQLNSCLHALAIDWWALASAAYQKKYGDSPISDYKEKTKRMAFLQRRGFSGEQIKAVFTELTNQPNRTG
ncbi:MAG: recombinase RecX [Rheinheimera sp.]|uniref:regulatory protein RecX n=1 Tax=Arsukibacterium sp. UBA3155 TaxID=1946058 RepID=UPI000C92EC41|nr:regulatory protein RecX [Arsukibacterium sp. UBA3155]MAD77359.1 recombinase RecX [Rheinheimera sp.]|tara:strand:+ start:20933 stop:21400 length:468 start_codon:yes stop_codon:yes gene_type:complete